MESDVISIDEFRRLLEDYPQREPQQATILAALDAYERVMALGNVQPSDLAAITVAATGRHLNVWDIGTDLLQRLAARFPEAQQAIRELMRSEKAPVRRHIVASLGGDLPDDFTTEIIQAALYDRSYLVRHQAAMLADKLMRRDLLPLLEERLAIEPDQRVRDSLAFHMAMLRDGYLVERDGDSHRLTSRADHGLIIQSIRPEDLHEGRIKAIVEETNARHRH